MTRIRAYIPVLLAPLAVALMLCSCERRPLYDMNSGALYVEVEPELDPDVRSAVPQIYCVAFYDPDTHALVHTDYVPPGGGYVDISPGTYDILAYNFDTDYTQVRNPELLTTLEAFTSPVTSDVSNRFYRVTEMLERYRSVSVSRTYDAKSLIYEPDHLYAGKVERFDVPYASPGDEVIRVKVKATTILEKYSIRIGPVQNAEYVKSAEVFLTGMASAKLVDAREMSGGPATIWFTIGLNDDKSEFTTYFRTFGRYPGTDNRVVLVVHIIDVTNNEYDGEWDVTDQIEDGGHEIVINDPITIVPTSGDGMTPTVNLWDETVTYVPVQ